jgi:hypothetical protein
MLIGDRLRALREQKICPKVTSKNAPDFSVAMFQELRTATLCRA